MEERESSKGGMMSVQDRQEAEHSACPNILSPWSHFWALILVNWQQVILASLTNTDRPQFLSPIHIHPLSLFSSSSCPTPLTQPAVMPCGHLQHLQHGAAAPRGYGWGQVS